MQKKIHGYYKQDRVNNSGNDDPFPEFMFTDKLVRLIVALKRYNDLFEQINYFADKYKRIETDRTE